MAAYPGTLRILGRFDNTPYPCRAHCRWRRARPPHRRRRCAGCGAATQRRVATAAPAPVTPSLSDHPRRLWNNRSRVRRRLPTHGVLGLQHVSRVRHPAQHVPARPGGTHGCLPAPPGIRCTGGPHRGRGRARPERPAKRQQQRFRRAPGVPAVRLRGRSPSSGEPSRRWRVREVFQPDPEHRLFSRSLLYFSELADAHRVCAPPGAVTDDTWSVIAGVNNGWNTPPRLLLRTEDRRNWLWRRRLPGSSRSTCRAISGKDPAYDGERSLVDFFGTWNVTDGVVAGGQLRLGQPAAAERPDAGLEWRGWLRQLRVQQPLAHLGAR